MASTVRHPTLSAAEFDALQAEHGWSAAMELVAGEAVVIPPNGTGSASALVELLVAVRDWQRRVGDDGLLLPEVFVLLGPRDRLGPDLAWWSGARRPAIGRGAATTVPDWVAEVLSPGTRENDLGPKRAAYLAAGVRELWLVDPETETITVVQGPAERIHRGSEVATSAVLDGFAVVAATLFID